MRAIAAFVLSAVVAAIGFWVFVPPRISGAEIAGALPAGFAADAAEGELLFHLGGCADCHTGRDRVQPSGGEPLNTRFGIFHAPNLTSDPDTGIGGWSDADFVNAMRLGISPEGRHYYPAFPYTAYANVHLTDLLHLKAYLDRLPAESSPAVPHEIQFPFNLRPALAFWKLAALHRQGSQDDPGKSELWNQGAYIANGLGHCGSCHTPRNFILVESGNSAFTGAPALTSGGRAAPGIAGLKPDRILDGLSEWSGTVDEDSSMFAVTRTFTEHVPPRIHDAIAEYLSSLSPD